MAQLVHELFDDSLPSTLESYTVRALEQHMEAMEHWIKAGHALRDLNRGITARCILSVVCITIPWIAEVTIPVIAASSVAGALFMICGFVFFFCMLGVITRLVMRKERRSQAEKSAGIVHRAAVTGSIAFAHAAIDPNYAKLTVESVCLYDELVTWKWMSPIEEVTN